MNAMRKSARRIKMLSVFKSHVENRKNKSSKPPFLRLGEGKFQILTSDRSLGIETAVFGGERGKNHNTSTRDEVRIETTVF